jgi:hypothetical protein
MKLVIVVNKEKSEVTSITCLSWFKNINKTDGILKKTSMRLKI